MQTVLPSDEDLKQELFHKQSEVISQEQKFPQLFKWKTATLITGSLTVILLIVLLLVVYNIQSEGQVNTNLTFLSTIVQTTSILVNKQEVLNLGENFQQIYGTTKFEEAALLYRGTSLTSKIVKQSIYSKENQKLLYIFNIELTENQNKYPIRFAAFMNSPFPIPEEQDFDNSLTYYSFEIKEERKSSLLSLNSKDSLKLFSMNPDVNSVSECLNYKFQPFNDERQGSFGLLNDLLWFDFASAEVKINTSGWKCFSPQFNSEEDMNTKLKSILNERINDPQTQISLKQFEVYYLS